MIYIIMGKSATGKDTVFSRLINDEELGLKKIIPYTTRPIREGETEGIEYHFVNEDTLNELLASGRVVEHRKYNTVHGVWHYFTVDDNDDIRSDARYAMIGTLEAYEKLRDYYGSRYIIPIYLEVEDYERLKRAMDREKAQKNPSFEEVCRRYIADEHDFSKDKLEALSITVHYKNDDVRECADKIKKDILLGIFMI